MRIQDREVKDTISQKHKIQEYQQQYEQYSKINEKVGRI